MNDEVLEMVEREVLGWSGVAGPESARRREGVVQAGEGSGSHRPPSTGSAAGRSGTSTIRAWRTSRSRGRYTTS